MAIDVLTYSPRGDKKNSAFFDEYRPKIYERRKKQWTGGTAGQHARCGDSGGTRRRSPYSASST